MKRTQHEEIQLLTNVVDRFANAMKAKLIECAKKGKSGWDGEHPEKDLCKQIVDDSEDIERGVAILSLDPIDKPTVAIDIANRAMMIWYRHHGYNLLRAEQPTV